jgi:hypothetical protein
MIGAEEWAAGVPVPVPGVRDRRSDRHQGDRRHHRSCLRGALEAVYALKPETPPGARNIITADRGDKPATEKETWLPRHLSSPAGRSMSAAR